MSNEELHKLWLEKGQGMKALKSVYQQGRADAIKELLSKNWWNPQQRMVMEDWLEQTKEQKNE